MEGAGPTELFGFMVRISEEPPLPGFYPTGWGDPTMYLSSL